MKLEVKFRREDVRETTYIWIDLLVDGTDKDVSPRHFISGPTREIGHLDPNVHSMEDYREALGISR